MSPTRVLAAAAALALLSGCALLGSGYDIEKIRGAEAVGTPFTRALTEEYRDIALFEADQMYDWADAGYFARKGLRAAGGEVAQPEQLADWRLPAGRVDEMASARASMVELLDQTARDKVPDLAAHAQGRFDCWVEQQEENHQPDHIAACREAFYAALEALRMAMAPKPMAEPEPEPEPAPPPPAPKRFVVFFAFDSAQISSDALTVIQDAIAAAQGRPVDFTVTGHADRSGPEDYNLALSLRRANAVRDALTGRGISAGRISVAGRGEAEPAVPTADGVREQANRRVEIILLQ